nr:MAG TPA: hypothetical protein [Caudoviricetes sp.]
MERAVVTLQAQEQETKRQKSQAEARTVVML